MIDAVVLVALFALVALAAFLVGLRTREIEREHAREIERQLHPTSAGASVIDPGAPEESVRLISEAPYDWQEGVDRDD